MAALTGEACFQLKMASEAIAKTNKMRFTVRRSYRIRADGLGEARPRGGNPAAAEIERCSRVFRCRVGLRWIALVFVRFSLLVLLLCSLAYGHEIPSDVTARLRIAETNGKVNVVARVPLKAMRDVEFPELPGGYLDVAKLAPQLQQIAETWIGNSIRIRGAGPLRVLATRLAIDSDRTFEDWQGQQQGELGKVVWGQLWFDVSMETERQEQGALVIRPGLHGLGKQVLTIVTYRGRSFELHGDPGYVELDPSWWSAAQRFTVGGFWHILEGMDHLLFLACLVLPVRAMRGLVWMITSFTVGHSITLIAAAVGFVPGGLWFPPAVEVAIAATILIAALGNLSQIESCAPIAFCFGLIHGFGFSFALKETLQFAGSHLMTSLLAFNLGVELGQLLIVGGLWVALRYVPLSRIAQITLNVLIAHTAWHWLLERFEILRKY